MALWAALLFLAKPGPQELTPTEIKATSILSSHKIEKHLLARWMPSELNISPSDRESQEWSRVANAGRGCWKVTACPSIVARRGWVSSEGIISNRYQCVFSHKENKKARALKWKFSRLGRGWKIKFGARDLLCADTESENMYFSH